jgi:hypothetical protein
VEYNVKQWLRIGVDHVMAERYGSGSTVSPVSPKVKDQVARDRADADGGVDGDTLHWQLLSSKEANA